jgi:hypothetical protein
MKLSNKILIGFFGFIFLYLTAALAELRLTGTPSVIDETNSIGETVDISGVSCLIVNGVDQEINIMGSDRAQLEVRSLSGDLLSKLRYKVTGDTLTLSAFESEDEKTTRISVFIPNKSLRRITANSSVVHVEDLQLERLLISQKSGTIRMTDCRISKMEIDANESYLDISGADLDTVSATIDRSTVNIFSPIGLIQGLMKNEAFLRLNNIKEIQVKKDESSRLFLY